MLYKFLKEGRVSPVVGYQWPEPGVWAEPVMGDLVMGRNGYHVTTEWGMAFWLDQELWEVEVWDEDVLWQGQWDAVARRTRLVRRLDKWEPGIAETYVRSMVLAIAGRMDEMPSGVIDEMEKAESVLEMASMLGDLYWGSDEGDHHLEHLRRVTRSVRYNYSTGLWNMLFPIAYEARLALTDWEEALMIQSQVLLGLVG